MKKTIRIFAINLCILTLCAGSALSAPCSRATLIRCLDSVCATNIGSNPSARCQLCGTSAAGAAPEKFGMMQLSVGTSAKNIISENELKSAPMDAGAKYAWASAECIKKNDGCTTDDVSAVYDTLIEKSCTAAGIDSKTNELLVSSARTKSANTCNDEIKSCIIADNRCRADFSACDGQPNFDKFFSACSVLAGGCGEHNVVVRKTLLTTRDTFVKNKATLIENISKTYANNRENKLKTVGVACENNTGKNACVARVCAENMENNCGAGFPMEKSVAMLLCAFYDRACGDLK